MEWTDKSKRVNSIIRHPLYIQNYRKIEEAEKDRKFCRHNMAHFLDVARIAMILNLEEEYGISYEIVYAAAMLHDIGRYEQYADGTPHEAASAEIAQLILAECGFDNKETHVIISAVQKHRTPETAPERNLNGLLYRADKMSRSCFACEAEPECDWKQDKKNRILRY